jgi:hypothetical protein
MGDSGKKLRNCLNFNNLEDIRGQFSYGFSKINRYLLFVISLISIFFSLRGAFKYLKGKARLIGFGLIAIFFLTGTGNLAAQDDRPAKPRKEKVKRSKPRGERSANKNPRVRETRFKMQMKKGDRPENRDLTGRRVKRNQRTKGPQINYSNYKPASRRTQYKNKPGFSSAPQRIRTASRKGEHSPRGDISGHRIKVSRSPKPSNRLTFNAPNPNVVKRGKSREGRKTYRSTYVRSVSGQNRGKPPFSSAPNPYVARSKKSREGRTRYASPSIRSRTAQDARSRNSTSAGGVKPPKSTGGTILSRRPSTTVRTSRTQPGDRAKSFSRKQGPVKSISGNIRNNRPSNPFAVANTKGKRSGDVARNRDITGRRLRENKRSPGKHITKVAPNPYLKRSERGESGVSNKKQLVKAGRTSKPGDHFAKTSFGGVRTSTRSGETATNRSASGKNIRTKNLRSGRPVFAGKQYPGYMTATKRGEGGFSGKSGKIRSSTRPRERAGVQPGGFKTATARGERSTNRDIAGKRLRARNKESRTTQIVGLSQKRTLSRSGELMNNGGRSLESRPPGKGTLQGGTFSGTLRAGKGTNAGPGAKYSGNVRSFKPPKGGGSITRLRNNKGNPLAAPKPGKGTIAGGRYSGNISKGPASKPGKGAIHGGNFSGNLRSRKGFYTTEKAYGLRTEKERLHNNKGNAIDQKMVGRGTIQGSAFRGKLSAKSNKPGKGAIAGNRYSGNLRKGPATKPGRGTIQGGNYRGNLRSRKGFYTNERTYAVRTQIDERLHNNKGNPLDGRQVGRGTIQGATYRGNLRADKSQKPGKGAIAGYRYQGNIRAKKDLERSEGTRYKGRLSARTATPKIQPQGQEYRGKMRASRGYDHQKAGDALKQTRAWYQIGTLRADKYAGNYRYKSPTRKDQHISSAFTGFNPGNAKKENDRFFKFKIWFAKLFRNETPRHLKNKGRKPRYDRGESDIWYR